jgi:hypothetical protein
MRSSWACLAVDLRAGDGLGFCGSAGRCSHSVLRCPSGIPTQPVSCLHHKELWLCVSEWIVPLVCWMGDDGTWR